MDKEKFLKSRTIVVTSAQIKALVATDVELIPAPGAGKAIELVSACLTNKFATTAYAWANTDHNITVGNATFTNDAAAQALIEAVARYSVVIRPPVTADVLAENTSLKLTASGTGEPTTGDGTLVIEVKYYVNDVTGTLD